MAVTDELDYIVYFENAPSATAPAQEVFVRDYLDPNLDWTTFRPTEVAFGDHVVPIQGSSGEFHTRLTIEDYRQGVDKDWWLDITAEVNNTSGLAKWTFRTLDLETGELPEDPYAGFLPANDPQTGCGEGHVTFRVRPNPGTPPGTVIRNSATNVFDTEAPVPTNEVWNTVIDTSLPFMIEETLRTANGRFRLRWNSWPGESYTIWSCSDLTSGEWSEQATVLSQGLSTLWTDSDTTSQRKFYRIELK